MQYRTLGHTELVVSAIGLGTFQFGGEWGKSFTESEVESIVGTALDCGINFIDTAECYGDHLAESLISKAIGAQRDRWIVATKFGHQFHGHMDRSDHWSPESVIDQLDRSLQALKTDHIDLYQFHSGNNADFDVDGLWEALGRQVDAGKVRHLGISVQHGLVMDDDLYQIESAKRVNVKAVQIVYNKLSHDADRLFLPYCEKHGLGVIARIPLGRGFLSGKYLVDHSFPEDDLRADQDAKTTAEMVQAVHELKMNEVPPNMKMAEYALRWILRSSAVHTCVVGCKNSEQVKMNALAGDD